MKQVIIELDDETLARLNKVAPARKRLRSEFIRAAIRQALNALVEDEMERAYLEQPPSSAEPPFDPDTWERRPTRRKKR